MTLSALALCLFRTPEFTYRELWQSGLTDARLARNDLVLREGAGNTCEAVNLLTGQAEKLDDNVYDLLDCDHYVFRSMPLNPGEASGPDARYRMTWYVDMKPVGSAEGLLGVSCGPKAFLADDPVLGDKVVKGSYLVASGQRLVPHTTGRVVQTGLARDGSEVILANGDYPQICFGPDGKELHLSGPPGTHGFGARLLPDGSFIGNAVPDANTGDGTIVPAFYKSGKWTVLPAPTKGDLGELGENLRFFFLDSRVGSVWLGGVSYDRPKLAGLPRGNSNRMFVLCAGKWSPLAKMTKGLPDGVDELYVEDTLESRALVYFHVGPDPEFPNNRRSEYHYGTVTVK